MLAAGRLRPSRGDVLFGGAVVIVYLIAAWLATRTLHLGPDRMMVLAERIAAGHLDSPRFAGTVDSVEIAGRYYLAVGPLQVLPYLLFVPFPGLWRYAAYAIPLAFGIAAAWSSLPLARAFGAGRRAYWVAVLTAFGTLLFYVSVFGDFYYLAHAESFLALSLLLIEWAGRRRPILLGLLLGISFLARPTTVLAAIPLGAVLVWQHRDWLRRGLAFASPVAIAIAAMALFDWARFGSATETGYALSFLSEPTLIQRRTLGVFSIAQVPENLRLALLAPFRIRSSLPFLVPDPHGLSMLLVSPALLTAAYAGLRSVSARVLWACSALVAIPVLLYYGGGYAQYGFRYSLDVTPFLVALVALGTQRRFGRIERALILASVASVAYGVLWHARV